MREKKKQERIPKCAALRQDTGRMELGRLRTNDRAATASTARILLTLQHMLRKARSVEPLGIVMVENDSCLLSSSNQ
jgi:hypothetical protein